MTNDGKEMLVVKFYCLETEREREVLMFSEISGMAVLSHIVC
jgi:hypothetical protein